MGRKHSVEYVKYLRLSVSKDMHEKLLILANHYDFYITDAARVVVCEFVDKKIEELGLKGESK